MVPAPFRSRRALRVLNVAAVGLALAAITSAIFGDHGGPSAMVTGMSTWLLGTLWAALLRWRRTMDGTSLRLGWAMSVPLALLNAAVCAGMLFGRSSASFFFFAIMGATLGAVIWVPALVATLMCFGAPIAWAQALAKKGLAGEERGELIVGLTCVVMSALGLLVSTFRGVPRSDTGHWVTQGLGMAGSFAGSAASVLALTREWRRRRFVANAEAG